jgi:hypothetical protein
MAAVMMVAGCGSSYLAARKALITEKMGTSETGKTREELENRWGKPVWERTEADGTVACTYEYNALTEPWLKPLDTVVPGSQEGGVIAFILAESAIFPYYVAKDVVVRDRYRAKVIYSADGVAVRERHYKIDNAVPIPAYESIPTLREQFEARVYRKAYVYYSLVHGPFPNFENCQMEVSPMLPDGELYLEDYLKSAFNGQLDEAGLYDSSEGTRILADMVKASYRQIGVFTGSVWEITLALEGPDGLIGRTTTEHFCPGKVTCAGMAQCFPGVIAAAFIDIVRSPEFCAKMASDPASCPPAIAVEPPASAALQIDAQAPWTGRWKVSSGVLGGTWILEQTGSTVRSTPDSSYKLEASVDGNTIRDTWAEQGQHPRDFKATLSEDGMSFNAQAFYWVSVYFTAKLTD